MYFCGPNLQKKIRKKIIPALSNPLKALTGKIINYKNKNTLIFGLLVKTLGKI